MSGIKNTAFILLLLALPCWAVQGDPCSAASSVSDVQFSLALKGDQAIFQEGEIIPLVLSFTSTAKNRYWADVRNYDRSGRLNIEYYCLEPEAPDPLAAYFKFGFFFGGGLGTDQALSSTPFIAEAELNEWRRPGRGHYRLYAVSYRVWRVPDSGEHTDYSRVDEIVRSNTVAFEVRAATPKWRSEQLHSAMQTLAHPPSQDAALHAARKLRFLNTKGSARQLAKVFSGPNGEYTHGWDFMFGLYGSPYREVAIAAMRDELAAPDHAITSEFLGTLAKLQVQADPLWNSPPAFQEDPGGDQAFPAQLQAHEKELLKAEIQRLVTALPRKAGAARALSLSAMLMAGGEDPALAKAIRPALIAAWENLPFETRSDLIQYRWPLIAGPEMLPVLRRIVAGPANHAELRNLALQHIHEIDPEAGRALILRNAQNVHAQASPELIALLPPEDIAVAIQPALQRIGRNLAQDTDYKLLDRFADDGALGMVRTTFEQHRGEWACDEQAAMLRYFLRVAPAYGAPEVAAALRAREDTGCYRFLLSDLEVGLPLAQQSAIEALDDPDLELVQNAAGALGKWGSADAESALWARLQRFHQEWAGRASELRRTPDEKSPGAQAQALEEVLVTAIAQGSGWICPPDKLTRLAGLVLTSEHAKRVETWIEEWKQGPATIMPVWFPEDNPNYSMLQYSTLTTDQLRVKLSQLPRGTQLQWQFWQPGQIIPPVTMEKQEQLYERMRAVAEQNGLTLEKANHP